MNESKQRRILILGATYPTYSNTYTENVCTGGIEEESLGMVRLYPIPFRYLDGSKRFHSFQWIRVMAKKHDRDSRPESLRIDPDSIQLEERVSSHKVRRSYLENSPHLCRSVEELKERQKATGVSLGIIIPKRIDGVNIEAQGPKARREWEAKKKALLMRGHLWGEKLKDLDFPDLRFLVRWQCDDDRCEGHEMSLHQWPIHELARKLKTDPERNQKICEKMWKELDQSSRDVFLFLGNFRSKRFNFGLMDSYSAPVRREGPLFQDLTD